MVKGIKCCNKVMRIWQNDEYRTLPFIIQCSKCLRWFDIDADLAWDKYEKFTKKETEAGIYGGQET